MVIYFSYIPAALSQEVADDLRAKGVTIMLVGNGKVDNLAPLSLVTGDPTKVVLAHTFSELVSREFMERISVTTCMAGKNDKQVWNVLSRF